MKKKIQTISDAESRLHSYIPNGVRYSGDNMTLKRMWPLLEKVGNPQQELKVIHIAGTSGKTSTAYYTAALLRSTGARVGLTVSPHVDKITERLQINGQPINEDKFCELLEEFLTLIDDALEPSYFELLIVFMYWVFARECVDYAVVETGMGGLLDGTNVVIREDKVCIITDIGIDHTRFLGDTLGKIAAQKAGIIHENNQTFMYEQSPEIMQQVKQRIKEKKGQLNIVDVPTIATDSQLALFQQRNYNLALKTVDYVSKRDKLTISSNINPVNIVVPGRMERITLDDGSTLIMDGAHNGQKMTTFVTSYKEIYDSKKAVILLALKMGKEYKEVIDGLSSIVNQIILTTFSTSQDLPAVSQDPTDILAYCREKNIEAKIVSNHEVAVQELLKSGSNIKIITGSFYLLGQVRPLFSVK